MPGYRAHPAPVWGSSLAEGTEAACTGAVDVAGVAGAAGTPRPR